uniref:Uncharacterized protein n=1 Tax=Tanacetum cinerariifolium TaxID=118510 RepID=A0A6L2N551_TANCI|nr:hypothetical protein [Tanacetum cinerariifolium]
MEEYIRLEEEKARRRGKEYNWETAKYGKIWYDEHVHDLRSVKTEFLAIVYNDALTSEVMPSYEPTVSPFNDNKIDFKISFDESNDEDYTVVFDKNNFFYKIISVNDLKTNSEIYNDKVNVPSFLSPKPTVSYIDDLDFLKDFEKELTAIVYNDVVTSKLDFLIEPTGMYHKKNVDYIYLLWEDLVYQVENKNSKEKNDIDDPMLNTMRVISRHQDTQIYDAILPDVLTNQKMLESKAYKEYYVVASRAEPPKAKTKYQKKADEPVTPSKSKSSPAAKAVISEVALIEAEKNKLATKRSKKDFHMSHASGSGDGVDIQSRVFDEQQPKVTGTNEGAGVRPEVPDVPKYTSESEDESWTFSQDDVEESYMNAGSKETKYDNDGYDLTHPYLSTYKAGDEEEEEEKQMMMKYLLIRECTHHHTINKLMNKKIKKAMTRLRKAQQENVQANQVTEDTHVTLTTMPPAAPQQSSSISSDLVSKFINPYSDTETEMSEFKQTNQFAKAISSFSGIVDNYLTSKMKYAVDVVVQLQTNNLRKEAQVENHEFLNQVDSAMKTIIKEQVQAQVSKIMSKIEKSVTESLKAKVLVRSTNQP